MAKVITKKIIELTNEEFEVLMDGLEVGVDTMRDHHGSWDADVIKLEGLIKLLSSV